MLITIILVRVLYYKQLVNPFSTPISLIIDRLASQIFINVMDMNIRNLGEELKN